MESLTEHDAQAEKNLKTPQGLQATESLLRRLIGATFNYGLGRILPKVLGFLLIPIYTLYLTPEDYGILELAAALSGFLVLFMRVGVPGAVTRFYFDYGEGAKLRDYVTTIFWFIVGSSAVVGGLALLVAPWLLNRLLPGLPYYPYVLLVVAAAFFSGNSDLQRRLIQTREQSSYSAKLSVALSAVTITLALTFIIGFGMGAAGMLLASVIAAVLFFAQALHYLWPQLSGRFYKVMLWGSLGYAFGILPSHLMGSLTPLVTRSLLANYDSVAAVGLFGLAMRFTNPLGLLVAAFNSAYIPIYFSIRKEKVAGSLAQLAQTACTIWLLAVLGFLIIALMGPPAVIILTPQQFHSTAPLIPILALGFLAQVIFTLFGSEVFYSKQTWLMAIFSVIAVGVDILVVVLTVETHGPFGLAWAMVAGLASFAIAGTVLTRRLIKIPVDWLGMVRIGAVGALALFAGSLIEFASPWAHMTLAVGILFGAGLLLWMAGDPAMKRAAEYLRTYGTHA